MRRVVITGIGVVTSNADNKIEFTSSLLQGKVGLKDISLFDTRNLRTNIGGQSSLKKTELKDVNDYERVEFLALKALKEALEDSGVNSEYLSKLDDRCGLSISTSLSGNERMMKYIAEKEEHKQSDPEWLIKVASFPNFLIQQTGIKGGIYTTESACAAGSAGTGIAYDLIHNDKMDVMVVGGADPLTEFACTGFHSLKSLSQSICRPFDEERDGIIIGEGSAFFVMESLENALKRHAKIYAEVLSYSIDNEAYHITSPNPTGEGAAKSMEEAIKYAHINKEDIDYINAHGTATKANDSMELEAIKSLFEEDASKVPVSSTKSIIGHCLGAAGSIELAACVLAINNNFIPGTANLNNVQEEYQNFNIIREPVKNRKINIALSNSFAFAGNTATVIVKRFDE